MDATTQAGALEHAYTYIRDQILALEFKPNTRLRTESLARLLGVSRTPVREALGRLEEAGLVVRDSGWGYTVRSISFKEAIELYKVREALEVEVVREALPRLQRQHLSQLRACLQTAKDDLKRGRTAEFRKKTRQFYRTITAATDNGCLIEILSHLEDRIHLLGAMMASHSDRPHQSLKDNVTLLDALERKDEAAAVAAIISHVASARETVTRYVMAEGARLTL